MLNFPHVLIFNAKYTEGIVFLPFSYEERQVLVKAI